MRAEREAAVLGIFGKELNAEEMIKLDLHIQNRARTPWKDALLASLEHRHRPRSRGTPA